MHPPVTPLGLGEPPPGHDRDAAPLRLGPQQRGQLGAHQGPARRRAGARGARRDVAEPLAGPAPERHRGRREACGERGGVRAELVQGLDPVRAEREERALAGGAVAGLEDHRLDAGLLERQRRGGAGDAAAGDEGGAGTGHERLLLVESRPERAPPVLGVGDAPGQLAGERGVGVQQRDPVLLLDEEQRMHAAGQRAVDQLADLRPPCGEPVQPAPQQRDGLIRLAARRSATAPRRSRGTRAAAPRPARAASR